MTIVTREMIGAAHDVMLAKGDFVLSAALLERIYLAMVIESCGELETFWEYKKALIGKDKRIAELDEFVGKPVGVVGEMPGTSGFTMACFNADDVPVGTTLYAIRALAAAPDGDKVEKEVG